MHESTLGLRWTTGSPTTVRPILLAASLALLASCATYQRPKHAVHFHAAVRELPNGTLEDAGLDRSSAYGIDGLVGVNRKGFGIEGAIFRATDDADPGYSLDTWEYSLGVRQTWFTDEVVQPYVGGGATLLSADERLPAVDQQEHYWGAYAHTGVGFVFGLFELGLDLRLVKTEEIDTADLSYVQASVFAGASF